MNGTIWVGVTIIPHAKQAHVQAFESEELAREYQDEAEAIATERDYTAWIEVAETEVETQ